MKERGQEVYLIRCVPRPITDCPLPEERSVTECVEEEQILCVFQAQELQVIKPHDARLEHKLVSFQCLNGSLMAVAGILKCCLKKYCAKVLSQPRYFNPLRTFCLILSPQSAAPASPSSFRAV